MASDAIPCRMCGQFPVGAVPKMHTNAEVANLIEEARLRARLDAIHDAIAVVRNEPEVSGLMPPELFLKATKDPESVVRAAVVATKKNIEAAIRMSLSKEAREMNDGKS